MYTKYFITKDDKQYLYTGAIPNDAKYILVSGSAGYPSFKYKADKILECTVSTYIKKVAIKDDFYDSEKRSETFKFEKYYLIRVLFKDNKHIFNYVHKENKNIFQTGALWL